MRARHLPFRCSRWKSKKSLNICQFPVRIAEIFEFQSLIGNVMSEDVSIDELMQRAAEGDDLARENLLRYHEVRLRRMVAARMDQRLKARWPIPRLPSWVQRVNNPIRRECKARSQAMHSAVESIGEKKRGSNPLRGD